VLTEQTLRRRQGPWRQGCRDAETDAALKPLWAAAQIERTAHADLRLVLRLSHLTASTPGAVGQVDGVAGGCRVADNLS
jgi:hypothetical protein